MSPKFLIWPPHFLSKWYSCLQYVSIMGILNYPHEPPASPIFTHLAPSNIRRVGFSERKTQDIGSGFPRLAGELCPMLMSPPKSQWHHQKPWKDTDESKEPLLPNRVKDRRSLFACHLWSRRKRTLKPKPFFPWGIYTYVLVMIIVSGQKLVQDRGIKAFHTTPNSNWDSTTHVIRWYLPYNINTITTSSTQPSHIPRSGRWITPTLTLTTLYKATILEGWHSLTGSSGIGTAKTFPKISFDSARAFKGLSDLTVDSRSLAAKKKRTGNNLEGKISGWLWCVYVYVYATCRCKCVCILCGIG